VIGFSSKHQSINQSIKKEHFRRQQRHASNVQKQKSKILTRCGGRNVHTRDTRHETVSIGQQIMACHLGIMRLSSLPLLHCRPLRDCTVLVRHPCLSLLTNSQDSRLTSVGRLPPGQFLPLAFPLGQFFPGRSPGPSLTSWNVSLWRTVAVSVHNAASMLYYIHYILYTNYLVPLIFRRILGNDTLGTIKCLLYFNKLILFPDLCIFLVKLPYLLFL